MGIDAGYIIFCVPSRYRSFKNRYEVTVSYLTKYLKDRHDYPQAPPHTSSWLRHCATRRMVAGSTPDGVIVIFP